MALGGSNITALAIDDLSLDDLAIMHVTDLRSMQTEIDAAEALWKARKEALQAALDIKYGEQATALRHAKGLDTGTVHIDASGLDVACQLGKRVEWDQPQLEALWQRIAAANDDPKIYIRISYSVAEAVYSGWPENVVAQFKPARTVKTDNPKYIISDPTDKRKK